MLRTNRGGEYETNSLITFCEKNGIIHEVSAHHTPQQNVIAERNNRTLKEIMNAMLLISRLSDNIWSKVVWSACYILNRVPYKKFDWTPYNYGKAVPPT